MAKRPRILITGGAGYIGSHLVARLLQQDMDVVVVDNLSTGSAGNISGTILNVFDVSDRRALMQVLGSGVDAVIHMAASISVPESVAMPGCYYQNNVVNTLNLAEACVEVGVPAVMFSSTAAVYGEPRSSFVDECHPLLPINPYGASKAMSERILMDVLGVAGIRYGIMRYFNVAGADADCRFGPPSVEVAPNLLNSVCAVLTGEREVLTVFGDDYPTADGTCIRDFVHIADLVDAHLRLLEHLLCNGQSMVVNFGYGRGVSVRQVIAAAEAVAGRPLPVRNAPRRPGDAAAVVSNPGRFVEAFGRIDAHSDVCLMVADTLRWQMHRCAVQQSRQTSI